MSQYTFTIGSEQQTLIPEADRVRCRLISIEDNKFDTTRLDFAFQLMDPDYDNEDMDEDTIALIREMSEGEAKHYERVNKPPAGEKMSKGLKIYKMLKWLNGGRDLEEGEQVDLGDYLRKDFLIDFHHVDKKSGPPDFAVVRDDKGNAVQKAAILKLRPAQRKRSSAGKAAAPEPAPAPRQATIPDTDDDAFDDDDELE